MTNEQFSQEYHLLNRVGQGSVVTHHAQSATGAMVVMVHFLQGTAEENSQVLRDLGALDAHHRARVLKVAEVDGQTAIVTKFILDFTTFNEWLASAAASPAAPVVVAPQEPKPEPRIERTPESPPRARVEPPPPPAREPGEFTRAFQSPAVPMPASAPPPDFVAPPPASPQTLEPQPNAPGEFTRVFRGLQFESAAAPVPSPPPESQRVPPLSPAQPILPASSVEPPRTVSAPPSGASPAAVPMPRVQPAPPPASNVSSFEWPGLISSPVPSTPAQPAPAGEYTLLFGKPELPALPPMAPSSDSGSRPAAASLDWSPRNSKPVPVSDDSYFERLAGAPAAQSYELPVQKQSAPPPPSFGGPSEFTRIISASPPMQSFTPTGPRPAAPPPPVHPPDPKKGSGDRVLLFSLIGVLIVAIVFVAVFAIVS